MYKHALPPGFTLKSEMKKKDQEEEGIQKYRELLFGQDAKQQKKREKFKKACCGSSRL